MRPTAFSVSADLIRPASAWPTPRKRAELKITQMNVSRYASAIRETPSKRSAATSSSTRLLRSCTVKSASRSALKTSVSAGARRGGKTDGVLTALGSLTEITSRETDEDVLERDLTSRDREHIGVVFVLLDQAGGCVDGQDLAVVHDRDAVAHRLRLLHRMRGQQDAAAALADALDSVPTLTPRLRVEA